MGHRLNSAEERRGHARSWFLLGRVHFVARLRTGLPLRVLNMSPDGMLVESPARLVPGRQVDVVLQSGSTREHAPWTVIHSRVGCVRGDSDLRYRAGLRRSAGSDYPRGSEALAGRNRLPAKGPPVRTPEAGLAEETHESVDGTGFGRQD
jgi:hypothetical protein